MIRRVRWRALLCGIVISALVASTASAAPGDYVTKPNGHDLGFITTSKSQSGSPELFISNNPESMDSTTIFPGKPSVLGYTLLQVGKTYRIYVAHTNNYGSTLNFALMIKGTSSGTFTLKKKAVAQGTNYDTIGVNSARNYLNSSYNQTLTIPTSWTYFDGPYTLTNKQNFQGWWEITVNSGSGVAIAVTAAPQGVDIQSNWRSGNVQDAPKTPRNGEDHQAVGLFKSTKIVNITVDLDTFTSVNDYKKDKIGHIFGTDDPTLDATGYDGWVVEAFSGAGQGSSYLPGNFGVLYKYNITFKSQNGRRGSIYVGRPSHPGEKNIGLVLRRSGSQAISLGPTLATDISKAWVIEENILGTPTGQTVSFEILIPGNIYLPYMLYIYRTS